MFYRSKVEVSAALLQLCLCTACQVGPDHEMMKRLQLPIDKVYKFAEIGTAFAHMEANKHLGKIVVTL